MINLEKEIEAYALRNALEYGKADPGRILPKLFQHGLKKEEIPNIMPKIQEIVKKINSLNEGEKQTRFLKLEGHVKAHEERQGLQELPNVKKKMVFRLAPYPSGALHIGNAKTYLLNALYAEKYKAKTILVMDDTIGSEEKQIMPDAYNMIEDAFEWLNVKYSKPIVYKSKRLKIYYKYAKELIKKDKVYVCHCSQEILRENRAIGKACGCRIFDPKIQMKRWKEMFKAKTGDAVLRIKTNMQHPNPAFRDRVLFRISEREHPKVGKKYSVWPTLEMSWAVDDHLLGITHILRGNDLMMETEMEKYIWDIFKWKHPETIHTGLVRIEGIEGAKLSKSKAQKEVLSGQFMGWDDPRTWSIQSLRRRGFKPEVIRQFVEEIGLNKNDINVPVENFYAINRKLRDRESMRYSFVKEPVEIKLTNNPGVTATKVPIHPDMEGKREVKVKKLYISLEDFENLKGKEIRLVHLFNMVLNKDKTAQFTTVDNKEIPKINWVSETVPCRILMPDGVWAEGFAEKAVNKLKKEEFIQFERYGFCKFDGTNKGTYEFWFAHK